MATRYLVMAIALAACRGNAPPRTAPTPATDPHGFLDQAASSPPLPTAPTAALAAPSRTATRSPSGLYSEVLRAGGPEQPRRQDAVVMTMDAWDASGRLVESYTVGDAFTLADGMPGMIEGLLQMRRGERRRLWISEPLQGKYRLAPGTIVADIELVDIVRQ